MTARAGKRTVRQGDALLRALPLLLLAALVAIVACSTTARRDSGPFYQDDGPPERVPASVAQTPDAIPRVEPFYAGANRPYRALGRLFTPITVDAPFHQRGLASWYGRQFQGNRTAMGERYDMLAMTAAHPTLPLPSYARVTNRRTGARVVVRINDRGPFKSDRVLDLSYAAAARLGIAAAGSGEVEIERITWREIDGSARGARYPRRYLLRYPRRYPLPQPAVMPDRCVGRSNSALSRRRPMPRRYAIG